MENRRSITFRPLRRVKKTGKLAVASYTQWYGLATANYNPFDLVIVDEYHNLSHSERVFDHTGEDLFFPNYDPHEMPEFSKNSLYPLTKHYEENLAFSYYSDGGTYGSPHTSYHGKGIDCMGTPTFTHFTANDIAAHHNEIDCFEVLTVGIVLNWLGWFLMGLNNAKISVTKS